MKKWFFIIISLVVSLFLAAVVIIGGVFAEMLMYPAPRSCDSDEWIREAFIHCKTPAEQGLTFEDIEFKNDKGLTIRGWYMPYPEAKKTIVMLHGYNTGRVESMRWVPALHKAGFNVLTFDFRNAGKSDSDFTSLGFFEKNDLKAAIDYLEANKGQESFAILGASMGGAAGMMQMAIDPRIKAGAFEGVFADAMGLNEELIKRDFGLPFPSLFSESFRTWVKIRKGFDLKEISPEKIIAQIAPRPVLTIHCNQDNYTAFSHGLRLAEAAKEPKVFWAAECTKHAEAWQSDPEKANALVTEFFQQHLP